MKFQLEPLLPREPFFFDNCVAALSADQPFVYSKINHGFWERLVQIDKLGFDAINLAPQDAEIVDRKLGVTGSAFAETGFLQELLDILKDLPAPETGFNFTASIDAWPRSHEIEGTPYQNRFACEKKIRAHVNLLQINHAQKAKITGLEFKTAIITGRFEEFSSRLAEAPFLLIAAEEVAGFGDFIGAKYMHQVKIDSALARQQRNQILQSAVNILNSQPDLHRLVLRAGGALSTWLSYKLFKIRPDLQIFDLGNALLLCNPSRAVQSNWVKVYLQSVKKEAEKIHAGVFSSVGLPAQPLTTLETKAFRNHDLVQLAFDRGVPLPVDDYDLSTPLAYPDAPVPFVENKAVDLDRVGDFLKLSLAANHHANAGPVSKLLESAMSHFLNLPIDRTVVACSSGTSGIQLAAALEAYRMGKRSLRWVSTAYGFFSTNIGPLADVRLLDTDPNGRLSVSALRSLPPNSWDGLIHVNLFGQQSDWDALRDYCKSQGKHFIVDNAVGLLDRAAGSQDNGDIEVISCHHTKPWGVGEGGLMIVNRDDESDIRNLMDFGARLPASANPQSTNAKISDFAAAAILDRIERMDYWSVFYKMQARRILSVIEDYDIPLTPLQGSPTTPLSPRAFVPLIADHSVDLSSFQNDTLVLRKYYRPLEPTPASVSSRKLSRIGGMFTQRKKLDNTQNRFPNANGLFSRILCLPCNPELREVPSEKLAEVLNKILDDR